MSIDADPALVASQSSQSLLSRPSGFDPGEECNFLEDAADVCPRHGHSHSHLYSPPALLEALAYAYGQGFRWPERFGLDRHALARIEARSDATPKSDAAEGESRNSSKTDSGSSVTVRGE